MSDEASLLGRFIRRERLRRGLTQTELAAMVHEANKRLQTNKRTIERWEHRHKPQPAALRALAQALGQPVEHLARLAGTLPAEEDVEVKRRTFLATMGAVLGASVVDSLDVERLVAPGVDAEWMADAEAVSIAIAGQKSRIAAQALVPAAVGHLRALEARLPACAELAAKTAQLTGALLNKSGALPQAYRCYSMAEAMGDPTVRARALTSLSDLHFRSGDMQGGVLLMDQAATVLRGAPLRAQAGLLARMAELHAAAGHEYEAMQALDAAERGIATSRDPHKWHYLNPTNGIELGAYRGSVLARLGRHQEAVGEFAWTLDRMDPALVEWRLKVTQDHQHSLAAL